MTMEHHLPDVHAFANDTQLYISFNANSSEEQSTALENMQKCIAQSEIGCYLTGLN